VRDQVDRPVKNGKLRAPFEKVIGQWILRSLTALIYHRERGIERSPQGARCGFAA
jgi:hypothetical protein